jgi:hypothetical protein
MLSQPSDAPRLAVFEKLKVCAIHQNWI